MWSAVSHIAHIMQAMLQPKDVTLLLNLPGGCGVGVMSIHDWWWLVANVIYSIMLQLSSTLQYFHVSRTKVIEVLNFPSARLGCGRKASRWACSRPCSWVTKRVWLCTCWCTLQPGDLLDRSECGHAAWICIYYIGWSINVSHIMSDLQYVQYDMPVISGQFLACNLDGSILNMQPMTKHCSTFLEHILGIESVRLFSLGAQGG